MLEGTFHQHTRCLVIFRVIGGCAPMPLQKHPYGSIRSLTAEAKARADLWLQRGCAHIGIPPARAGVLPAPTDPETELPIRSTISPLTLPETPHPMRAPDLLPNACKRIEFCKPYPVNEHRATRSTCSSTDFGVHLP